MVSRKNDLIQGYSKGLDLSPEGLRFYERRGIVQPTRDEKTGYRYYSFRDTVAVTSCRKLRCWGYSVEEASDTLKNKNFDDQVDSLEEHAETLKQELARQQLLLERLQEVEAVIKDSLEHLEEPLSVQLPALSFLPTRIKHETIRNADLLKQINSWNKSQPFPEIAFYNNGAETLTGLVMNRKYMDLLHLPWQEEFHETHGISLSLIQSMDDLEKGTYIKKAEEITGRSLARKQILTVLLSASLQKNDMHVLCRILIPD